MENLSGIRSIERPIYERVYSSVKGAGCAIFQLFSSVVHAVPAEIRAFKRHFSKNPAVQSLAQFFRGKTAVPQKKEEPAPSQGVHLLESHVEKIDPQALEPKNRASLWKKYKEFSELKKEPSEWTVSSEELGFLSGSASVSKKEQLFKMLPFLQGFFAQQKKPCPIDEKVIEAFDLARANELAALLPKEQKKTLNQRADELQQSIASLSAGKPFIYFGSLSNSAVEEGSFLDASLKSTLPRPIYSWITFSKEKLSRYLKSFILDQIDQSSLKVEDIKQIGDRIETSVREVLVECSRGFQRALPSSWYEKVVDVLKRDLHELAFGNVAKEDFDKRLGVIWQKIEEGGVRKSIEEQLEKIFDSLLTEGKLKTDAALNELFGNISRALPQEALNAFSLAGIQMDIESAFWIEIRKQSNGNYSLHFFSNDSSGTVHEPMLQGVKEGRLLPLVFSDIPLQAFNKDFFQRLLSFQDWKADELVDYTLQDVKEGLLDVCLGPYEQKPNDTNVVPWNQPLGNDLLDWIKVYIYHHGNDRAYDFQKLFEFDLPYQTLIHFWPAVVKNPALLKDPKVCRQIQLLLDRISTNAVRLFEEKKLAQKELCAIYATVYEAQKALDTRPPTKKTFAPSTIVPAELQAQVKALMDQMGCTPNNVEFFKSALRSLLGEEVDEALDLLFEELIPKGDDTPVELAKKEASWKEVFGVQKVEDLIKTVGSMHFSLLHFGRVCGKVAALVAMYFESAFGAGLIEGALRLFFPHLTLYTTLSFRVIARLLGLYGPAVLKKIFPANVHGPLAAFFNLFSEIVNYIKTRIALIVTRFLLSRLLGLEQWSLIKNSVHTIQADLTRKGSLSFESAHEIPIAKKKKDNPLVLEGQLKLEPSEYVSERSSLFTIKNILPLPDAAPITPGDVKGKLEEWIHNSAILRKSNPECVLPFLNAQLRLLPIPNTKEGKLFWQQVGSPEVVLELLLTLCLDIKDAQSLPISMEEHAESVVSFFSCYAIADILARLSPKSYLTNDYLANGMQLAHFLGSPTFNILNPRSYEAFLDLAEYFGFERKFRPYTEEELEDYRAQKGRLFQYASFDGLSSNLGHRQSSFAWTADCDYFSLLLETSGEVKQKLKQAMSKKNGQFDEMFFLLLDPQVGSSPNERLLPRPFHILRFMDMLCRNISLEPHKLPKDRHLEFFFPKEKEPQNPISLVFGKLVEKPFHKLTQNLFKFGELRANYQIWTQTDHITDRSDVSRKRQTYLPFIISPLPFVSENPLVYAVQTQNKTLWSSKKNPTQSEIMSRAPLSECGKMEPEVNRIFQMLRLHRSDQIVRCFAFFEDQPTRFTDPVWRSLFDTIVNEVGAIDEQLQTRPEIIKDWGKLFEKWLKQMKSDFDLGAILFLSKIANDLLAHCARYDKNAYSYFPNFAKELEELRPRVQKGEFRPIYERDSSNLALCDLHQILCYRHLDPKQASLKELEEAVFYISRYFLSITENHETGNLDLKCACAKLFYKWHPFIFRALYNDEAQRNKILDAISADAGYNLENFSGGWKTSVFQDRFYKGDLNGNHLVIAPFSQKHKCSEIKQIKLDRTDTAPSVGKKVNVKRYFKKGLRLLNWFEPMSRMGVRGRIENAQAVLEEITFRRFGLKFKIENVKNQKQAVCADGKTPGFYIAKNQSDPRLNAYSRYLLLENEAGKKKVHLPAESMGELVSAFLLKNMAHLPSSPLIENSVQHFLEEISLKKSFKNLLTYTINDKGELESNDPEAIAHLVAFHFVNNDIEACFRYFSQLEEMGRLAPFSKSVYELIDALTLPLLISKDQKAEELLLRLEAIRSENALIAHKGRMRFGSRGGNLLRWGGVQSRYSAYLKKVENGAVPYLGPEKELFILKSIALSSMNIARDQFGDMIDSDSYAAKLLQKIGMDNLAEHLLMIPLLSKRFHQLKKQFGESSRWGEILRFCASFLEESAKRPSVLISRKIHEGVNRFSFSKYSRKEGLISRILSIAKQTFATGKLNLLNEEMLVDFQPVDDAFSFEFLDLTPKNIRKNFLSLYQIAFGKVPQSFKSNPKKIQAFENKRKKLEIYLSMLRGKSQEPLVDALITILKEVYEGKTSSIKSLISVAPAPKKLEKLLIKDLENGDCLFEEALLPTLENYKKRTYLKYGFKAIFGNSIKEASINTTKFVAKKLFFSTIGAPLKFLDWTARGWFVFKNIVPVGGDKEKRGISHKNIPSGPRALPASLSQALVQREQAIDSLMKELLETYFNPEEGGAQQKEEPKVAPYEFKENEELNEVNFRELNQSLEEYYERPVQKKHTYTLKKEKSGQDLLKDLSQLRDAIEKDYLHPERCEMVKFVNYDFKEPLSEDELLIEKLRDVTRSKKEEISFQEIDRLFILHQEHTLIERTGMNIKQLEELRKRWYLYHLMSSRWNLLFDQVAKCKGDVLAIASELERRRAYEFSVDEKSERLVRSLLVFESRSKKMLWKDQCDQTIKLLMNPKNQKLLQLIMAGGKSWFIIPAVSHCGTEGENEREPSKPQKKLMINVWPSSLANTNIEQSAKQGNQIYHQSTNRFDVKREHRWEKSYGWALRHMFRRAFENGEKIDTTKEDLQAFELNLLEQAFEAEDPTEAKESVLDDFVSIGGLIQSNGVFNTDELHEQRNPTKQLNYPLGPEQKVPHPYVDIFSDCLYEVMTCCKELGKQIAAIQKEPQLLLNGECQKEFAHLLKNSQEISEKSQLSILADLAEKLNIISLKSDAPEPISESEYQEKILPILARKIAAFPAFKLNEKQKKLFEIYLAGKAAKIPDCVALNQERAQMALLKGYLTVCLPQRLASIIHVDYHQSLQGNGEFARPSEGNINPLEDAIIRNPYEALDKSASLLLRNRLNPAQMHKLLDFLKKRGESAAKLRQCRFEQTREALFFNNHCPGYRLQDFEKHFDEIRTKLNMSDRVVLTYFSHFVAKQIVFYPENLPQNSSNFTSMCQEINGFTGTDYNKGCYPKGMEILSNPGTDGESVDFLEKNASVVQLEKESPKDVLEGIKSWFDRTPKGRSFTDVDAGLNGIATKDVMRDLLQYIEKRKDIDAVAGFIGSEKVIWQKGAPEPVPFDQVRIPPERRLTYYDNGHFFGSDIDQMAEAEMAIFYSGGPAYKLFQGMWRQRGLKTLNQKITLLTTKKASEKITKSPNKIPTPREMIAFGKKTEEEMLKKLNYASDRQEMHDIIRRAILIKGYETGTFRGFRAIVSRFPDIFKRKLQTDPYLLFGQIDAWVAPDEIFKQLRTKLFEIAKSAKLFSKEELELIAQQLNQLGHGDYPKKVHVYKSSKGISEDTLDDMNKSSTVQVSEQNSVKNEENEQTQLQVEEQSHEMNLTDAKERKPQTFFPWNPSLNPTILDTWLHLGENKKAGVPLFSVKETLAKTDPVRQAIAKHLSSKILATNNVIHQKPKNSAPVKPFGKYQIPIFKALVVSHNKECPKIILVDQEESENFWKERLKMDRRQMFPTRDPFVKVGLYDIHTKTLVAEGGNAFKKELESPEFKLAMVQVKFLSGSLDYDEEEQKILKEWMRNDPEGMNRYFQAVHKHHGTAPYSGSHVEAIYLELTDKKEHYKL